MQLERERLDDRAALPWQLRVFRHTLKKQQKLRALVDTLGNVDGQRCLLITCGDNNGALNWHLREQGGAWSWADAEETSIAQIADLTGDPVTAMDKGNPALPFADNSFDVIVTIDVHEHLARPEKVNRELARLIRPGGTVIVTTPNGNERKLANRFKRLLGMRPADYGHVVSGYDTPELQSQLRQAGLRPFASSSYARFFTEMVELALNFAYVKVLAGRSAAKVEQGQIAPQSQEQLQSVEKSYKLYARIYPLMRLISRLDVLDRSGRGYAVIVAARKE